MAKCTCKVNFKRFQWNRAGYQQVMNGQPASMALDMAKATADRANSMSNNAGYEAKAIQGKFVKGAVARTGSIESRRDNAKHNTLLKAKP